MKVKICPNCGHGDHMMWRPRRSRVFCSYTRTDTVAWNRPKLMKAIREVDPEPYYDGHFMYHITKGDNVERIERELWEYMGFGKEDQERRVEAD